MVILEIEFNCLPYGNNCPSMSVKVCLFFFFNLIGLMVCRISVYGIIYDIVVAGEIANFIAYAFAPAILVTPLGALSIIIR